MSSKAGHTGSGGLATDEQTNLQRKQRLRGLMLEQGDFKNDPYFMKNHLGSYECKLCLSLHTNEGNYLAHTQGRRHQLNLAKRAAKDKRDAERSGQILAAKQQRQSQTTPFTTTPAVHIRRIGRPAYRIVKQYDHLTHQRSLLFQLDYPHVFSSIQPRIRLMSSYEHAAYHKRQQDAHERQMTEYHSAMQQYQLNMQHYQPHPNRPPPQPPQPPAPLPPQHQNTPQSTADPHHQYLLVSADPYDIIGFAVPSLPLDRASNKFMTHWDEEKKVFTVQIYFLNQVKQGVTE